MELEKRVAALEDANNAMAAQLTALQVVFRTVAPFISPGSSQMRAALLRIYDTTSSLMDDHQQRPEFQADVLKWIDAFSRAALDGGHIQPPHQSTP
jgi:L-serine deaminase